MRLRQIDQNWIVDCPAKLNLFLEVLGKRPDGYHEIDTVMAEINLFDTLCVKENLTHDISLKCYHAGSRYQVSMQRDDVPDGPNNLVMKAAELLRVRCNKAVGVDISLIKRTPAAAGMAGGSSDAAAVMIALNQIWGMKLSREELQQMACKIGSDVCFFLSPAPIAVCKGRGEVLKPHQIPFRMHFVIARSETGLSTAEVYRHCSPERAARGSENLMKSLQQGDFKRVAQLMHNSLQPPAEKLNEEVSWLKKEFARLPVAAHMMTGSGTAYFGICQTHSQAMTAAARLRATGLERVFVAHCPP